MTIEKKTRAIVSELINELWWYKGAVRLRFSDDDMSASQLRIGKLIGDLQHLAPVGTEWYNCHLLQAEEDRLPDAYYPQPGEKL